MRYLETDTASNVNISGATAIGAYTADADRLIICDVMIDAVAGGGDYVMYITKRINGADSTYIILPKSTLTAAAGETAISGQSGMIAVRSGDVLTVFIDGLAGDTTTPDYTTRWFELAALKPATADRTINVDADGKTVLQATQTGVTIPTVTNLTNLPAVPTDWLTAAGIKADAVTKIQAALATSAELTAMKGAGWTTETMKNIKDAIVALAILDAAGVRTALGLAAANLDTQLAGVAKTGADGDTLETLSDQIDVVTAKTDNLPTDPADQSLLMASIAGVPAAVWGVLTSTLTVAGTIGKWVMDLVTAVYNSLAAIPAVALGMPTSGDIDVYVYDTLTFSISDLGSLANLVKLYVTFKDNYDDEDSEAILQLEQSQGLLIANGATATATDGSIALVDLVGGDITGLAAASVVDDLEDVKNCVYDVKIIRSAGVPVETLMMGKAKFHRTVTRAIA